MTGTQMQRDRSGPSGHGVTPGHAARSYSVVEIGLSVAFTTDPSGDVAEYWWSLTPDPGSIKALTSGQVDTVIWRVTEAWILDDGTNLPGVIWWHDPPHEPGNMGGVVMDTDGDIPWNTDWGIPIRGQGTNKHAYILEISAATDGTLPATGVPYRYTLNVDIGRTRSQFHTVSLDPEIEMGEG